MSSEDRAVGGPFAGMLLVLDEGLYAIVGLVVVLLANILLDGWTVVAVLAIVIVCVFVVYGIRDRGPRAAERRRAMGAFYEMLDPSERRLYKVVRWVPFVAFFSTLFAGLHASVTGAIMLGTLLLTQLLFGVWLRVRGAGAHSRA